jgi:D-alanyl-D-alanine carboxypeptidase
MAWPADTQTALNSFYSKHKLGQLGSPTAKWESTNLTLIQVPYPMALAWDTTVRVKKVRCHKLVAASLLRVLQGILAHYGGDPGEVQQARMDLFGGCYSFRRISGSGRLSTHAWGAGIDLDPDRNPLGKPHSEPEGMMPLAVVSLFEAEGWRWGGRFVNRPDCMHFQATV